MDFSHIGDFVLPGLGVAVIAYLLGSLSFSIILTRIFKNHEDIRSYGSGNAGATNVLRSVGKGAAALTFLLDFLKCVVAVVVGKLIFGYVATQLGVGDTAAQYGAFIAGFACLLGHVFPVYFGFRGKCRKQFWKDLGFWLPVFSFLSACCLLSAGRAGENSVQSWARQRAELEKTACRVGQEGVMNGCHPKAATWLLSKPIFRLIAASELSEHVN